MSDRMRTTVYASTAVEAKAKAHEACARYFGTHAYRIVDASASPFTFTSTGGGIVTRYEVDVEAVGLVPTTAEGTDTRTAGQPADA